MPFPLALIPAAASLAGGLFNTFAQGGQNRKNREFAADQAEIEFQRNQQMWRMNNEYNTPSAQMQRFKDAGLNPHLIYGRGTPGNAETIKYNAPKWQGDAPQFTMPDMIGMYTDLKRTKIMDEVSKQKIEVDKERQMNLSLLNTIKAVDASYAPQLAKYNLQQKKLLNDITTQRIQNLALKNQVDMAKLKYDMWRYKYIKDNEYSPEGSFNIFKQTFKQLPKVPGIMNQLDRWSRSNR